MKKIAVVLGASNTRSKFGNKAVRIYRDHGWGVVPVNLHETAIEGIPAYATLSEVGRKYPRVDRILVYLHPDVTLAMVSEIAALQSGAVFLNPGAESHELVRALDAAGVNVRCECAIVEIGASPAEAPN